MATLVKIASYSVPAGGASSVTFNAIPGDFTHLKFVTSIRDNSASVRNWCQIRFNNDSTSTTYYERIFYTTNGTSAGSSVNPNGNEFSWMGINGNSSTSSAFGSAFMDIAHYATNKYKVGTMHYVSENNGAEVGLGTNCFVWKTTSAITRVDFISPSSTFQENSTFTLYGISNK